MYAESVVGVVLRSGVGHQFGKSFPAERGEHVDPLCPSFHEQFGTGVLGDESVFLKSTECRVQRSVRKRSKSSEQAGQPLAELVAVHG